MLTGSLILLNIEELEDGEDLALRDSFGGRVESVESGVNLVHEFLGGVTILQTTSNSVCVADCDELSKLCAVKKSITIGIAGVETFVNLGLEGTSGFGVSSKCFFKLGTLCSLFFSE